MPIHSESKPFASRKSFLGDIRDKMHTSPFLGQIGLESPDPSLQGVRSILSPCLAPPRIVSSLYPPALDQAPGPGNRSALQCCRRPNHRRLQRALRQAHRGFRRNENPADQSLRSVARCCRLCRRGAAFRRVLGVCSLQGICSPRLATVTLENLPESS